MPNPQAIANKVVATIKNQSRDPAVLSTLILRVSVALVPFISVLIVVRFLNVEQQGYWYLFGSILTMAGNAELGFGQIISRLTAMDWGKLKLGNEASHARLQNLLKLTITFGLGFGLIISVVTGVAGYFWIATRDTVKSSQVDWQTAWWLTSIAGPLLISLSMTNSFFEGCQLITTVNVRRFVMSWGSLVGSAAVLTMGGGLLGFSATRMVPLVVGLLLILWQHKTMWELFRGWWSAPAVVSWSHEVWPLQWRYALSWSSGLLVNGLYVPVVFNYRGAEDGGRFGLAMNIINFVFTTTTMMTGAKSPKLSMLYGQRRYTEMVKELKGVVVLSAILLGLLSVGLIGCLYGVHFLRPGFAQRLLPMDLMIVALLGVAGNTVFTIASTFARSLNAEPFSRLSVIHGLVTAAALPPATIYFGVSGAIITWTVLWCAIGAWATSIAVRRWKTATASEPFMAQIASANA